MTPGQTAIPVPVEPDRGACAWCSADTSNKLILEQNWTTSRGTRVPKSTKWAWCCDQCDRRLQRRDGAST